MIIQKSLSDYSDSARFFVKPPTLPVLYGYLLLILLFMSTRMDECKCYYCPEGFHGRKKRFFVFLNSLKKYFQTIKWFASVGNKLGYRTLNYTVTPSEGRDVENRLEIKNGSVTLSGNDIPPDLRSVKSGCKSITYSK